MPSNRLQYIFDLLKGKNTVGPEFDQLNKQSKAFQENIGKAAKAATIAFAGLSTVIGGTIASAAGFEDVSTQFEVLTGSTERAAAAIAQLKDFSAGTPFQFEEIAQAGKQLLGFGFDVAELTDKLNDIGNVAAASGTQIQEISLIFGQVAAAGKLTGERLLQFQERAIPIGPAIAKTLGIAESSVKDFVSQGKVDFKTFEKAFASLSEKGGFAFGGLEKQSRTLNGKISTLKDNVSILSSTIGSVFLPTAKKAVDGLIKFVQALRSNEELTTLIAKMLAMGAAFSGALAVLGGTIIILAKLKVAFAAASAAAVALGISLKAAVIGTGVGAAIIALTGLITDLYINWNKRTKQIIVIWKGATAFVKESAAIIKSTIQKMFDIDTSFIVNTYNNIVVFFESIKQKAEEFSNDVKEKIKDAIDSTGITTAINKVKGVFNSVKDRVSNTFNDVTEIVGNQFNNIVKKGKEASKNIIDTETIKESAGKISDSFSTALTKVKKGLKKVNKEFQKPKTLKVKPKFEKPEEKDVAKSLSDIKKIFEKNKSIIKDPFNLLIDPETMNLNKLGDALTNVLEEPAKSFRKFITKITPEEAASFGTGLFSAITSGKKGAKAALKGAAKAVGTAFGGPIGGAIVEAVIEPLMMAPEEFASMIMDFFTSLPQLISNIFINGINFDAIAVKGIMAFVDQIPMLVDSLTSAIITRTADPTFTANLAVNLSLAILKAVAKLPEAVTSGFRDGINNALANTKENFRQVFKDGGKQVLNGIISGINKFADIGRTIGREFIVQIIGVGKKIASEFKSAIGNIIPGVSGASGILGSVLGALTGTTLGSIVGGPVGGIVGGIGGALGFARGGEIPSGFPNDSFPARLTSGENVIDRSTNINLKRFLNNNRGNTDFLLEEVIALLKTPQMVKASVEVENEAFAEIILNLTRNNQRLA